MIDLDPQPLTFPIKKPVLPGKPVFNLHAGFFKPNFSKICFGGKISHLSKITKTPTFDDSARENCLFAPSKKFA
jgi:hypothetical protein